MRALSVHTYMGVMQIGAGRAGLEVTGSMEAYKPGLRARAAGRGMFC